MSKCISCPYYEKVPIEVDVHTGRLIYDDVCNQYEVILGRKRAMQSTVYNYGRPIGQVSTYAIVPAKECDVTFEESAEAV